MYCRTIKIGQADIRITFENKEEAMKYSEEQIYEMGKEMFKQMKNAKPMEDIPF